jgi:hypothetical protein
MQRIFNTRTREPEASMLTTRPPKPSKEEYSCTSTPPPRVGLRVCYRAPLPGSHCVGTHSSQQTLQMSSICMTARMDASDEGPSGCFKGRELVRNILTGIRNCEVSLRLQLGLNKLRTLSVPTDKIGKSGPCPGKWQGITRKDWARPAIPNFFMYCSLYSVYCLCVNVYCTTATGCQTNCS